MTMAHFKNILLQQNATDREHIESDKAISRAWKSF